MHRSAALALLVLPLLTGCGTPTEDLDTQTPPDATGQADPFFSPDSIGREEGFEIQPVVDGLEHPWGMAWLPDGTILVTERPGRLRLIENGQLVAAPVAGMPDVLSLRQGGLMDVAVDPDFARNQTIYLSYVVGTDEANRTRIARARLNGGALSDVEVLFENDRTKSGGQHFGSRLVMMPDGTLLASIGDGGNPPVSLDGGPVRDQAQNPNSYFGKVIRIATDGSAPQDNPFASGGGAAEVYSYGHRNIQGMALDPQTGQVWASEHGARGGDEVNRIEGGSNYGWPAVTYSEEYRGGAVSDVTTRDDVAPPTLVWTPSIAPSGLAFYTGDRFSDWQGDLFAGGLVSADVRRIDLNADGSVAGETSLFVGSRVRDVRQGPDGLLYVLTDAPDGSLLRLAPTG
jgi:glucose/arabinose dehydrogenase